MAAQRVLALFIGFGLSLGMAADDLPDSPARATFVKMCSNCHALARVTKVKFSKKFWTSVVDDMVARGAEGTEDEASSVIDYLSSHFGKPVNVNTATASQLQEGLSFKAAEAEALLAHRTANGPVKTYEDLLKVSGLNAKLLEEQKNNLQF